MTYELGGNATLVLLALIITAGIVLYRFASRPRKGVHTIDTPGVSAETTNVDPDGIRALNADLRNLTAELASANRDLDTMLGNTERGAK